MRTKMQLKDDTSVPCGTVSIEGKSNENADFTITYCFDLALALQFVMPIEIPFFASPFAHYSLVMTIKRFVSSKHISLRVAILYFTNGVWLLCVVCALTECDGMS
jgi:hypothetical protein